MKSFIEIDGTFINVDEIKKIQIIDNLITIFYKDKGYDQFGFPHLNKETLTILIKEVIRDLRNSTCSSLTDLIEWEE